MSDYVHGYDAGANTRLDDQADALVQVIHDGTRYHTGEAVLEVGCGVGSQTITLVERHPHTKFTSIDISHTSLEQAQLKLTGKSTNVTFHQANLLDLPFEDDAFDHAFVCFVLEHIANPLAALGELKRVVRPGGSITVIDGDHGSVIMHPESEAAHAAIGCQVTLQAQGGGDAMIGRALYPLLVTAGLKHVTAQARQIYTNGGTPKLADAFTRKTFTAMIAAVRKDALEANLISGELFDDGIAALETAAGPTGTFAYTFYKAEARVP